MVARMSSRKARRGVLTNTYARLMAIARRKQGPRQEASAPPAGADRYAGLWVAVKDGKVVTAAVTSRELVYRLAELGPEARGATMQRVPAAERGLLVGLG